MSKPAAYRLSHQPLGKGGQAVVFRATRKVDTVEVALKRLRGREQDAVDRMRIEIDIQRQLSHPNIMPILDHDADDFHWYAMPIARQTLAALTAPLSMVAIRMLFEQCVAGLSHAHSHGYTHRDVNPRNILDLGQSDVPQWTLADWGCAKRPPGQTTKVRTVAGQFVGTLGYAPPEIWSSPHSLGPPADVYGLGRVLAWALTGEVPRPNESLIPAGPLGSVVAQMTDPMPAKRIRSVDAALSLFNSALAPPAQASVDPFIERVNSRAEAIRQQKEAAHAEEERVSRAAALLRDQANPELERLLELTRELAQRANAALPEDHQIHVEHEPQMLSLTVGAYTVVLRHHFQTFLDPADFHAVAIESRRRSWRQNDIDRLDDHKFHLSVNYGGEFRWHQYGRELTTRQLAEWAVERVLELAQ